MNDKPKWLPDPKVCIAFAIIFMFAMAYFQTPTPDDVMKGALIAAFAGAWGFYLGSSKGAAENRDQINKTTDTAIAALAQNAGAGPPPPAQPLGQDPQG